LRWWPNRDRLHIHVYLRIDSKEDGVSRYTPKMSSSSANSSNGRQTSSPTSSAWATVPSVRHH